MIRKLPDKMSLPLDEMVGLINFDFFRPKFWALYTPTPSRVILAIESMPELFLQLSPEYSTIFGQFCCARLWSEMASEEKLFFHKLPECFANFGYLFDFSWKFYRDYVMLFLFFGQSFEKVRARWGIQAFDSLLNSTRAPKITKTKSNTCGSS